MATATVASIQVAAARPDARPNPGFVKVFIYFASNQVGFLEPPGIRMVRPPEVEKKTLALLVKGPNPRETRRGAIQLFHKSVRIAGFSIRGNVAHANFTGNLCSIPGAAFNQGALINRTLKQFPKVKWVKIYLDGQTQNPAGDSDSIPTCLEP